MTEFKFDYRRLRADLKRLGVRVNHLPDIFMDVFGEEVNKQTCFSWFNRGYMSLDRFCQLLIAVDQECGGRLDVWDYIPGGGSAAVVANRGVEQHKASYSIDEVADRHKCARGTIYKWMRTRGFPRGGISSKVRYVSASAVHAWERIHTPWMHQK